MRHAAIGRIDRFRSEENATVTRFARKLNKRAAIADPDLAPVVMARVVVIEALAEGPVSAFPLFENRTVPQDRLNAASAGKLTVLRDYPLTNPEIER